LETSAGTGPPTRATGPARALGDVQNKTPTLPGFLGCSQKETPALSGLAGGAQKKTPALSGLNTKND